MGLWYSEERIRQLAHEIWEREGLRTAVTIREALPCHGGLRGRFGQAPGRTLPVCQWSRS
jgi:hypothetical protein